MQHYLYVHRGGAKCGGWGGGGAANHDVFSSHFSLDAFCGPTGGVTITNPLSQMRKLTPRRDSNLLKVTLLVMAELEFKFRSRGLQLAALNPTLFCRLASEA